MWDKTDLLTTLDSAAQISSVGCVDVGRGKAGLCGVTRLQPLTLENPTPRLQIYTPLFLAHALLTRKPLWAVVTDVLPAIVRSSVFLGAWGSSLIGSSAALRKLLGRYYVTTIGIIPTLLSGWALYIERRSRRQELAVYWCVCGPSRCRCRASVSLALSFAIRASLPPSVGPALNTLRRRLATAWPWVRSTLRSDTLVRWPHLLVCRAV